AQTLAPGESFTFHLSGSYQPEQAEIDAGKVINTATATGTTPSGTSYESDPDTEQVPPDQAPGLSLRKSGQLKDTNGNNLADAGEEIIYTFVVKNTGAVTMTNVTVNDPMLTRNNLTVTPGPQTLAPGQEAIFTATYTAKQEDIDGGKVENTATGAGTPPGGDTPIESPPSTVVVPPNEATGLEIRKSGQLKDTNGNKLADAGEEIVYTFVVKNTGAVTMSGVTVNDPMLARNGLTVTPGPQTLAPGEEVIFTATYTAKQEDIDGGKVENTATGTGTPPGGNTPIDSPPSTVVVPPNEATGLSVRKSGQLQDTNGNNLADVGEEIVYTFVVKNTGAVTMTGVTVNDPMLARNGLTVTPGPQTLAPGAEAIFTATYTAKQEDIDGGKVENTATGIGTPPGGGTPIDSPPDTVTVPPNDAAGLEIRKSGELKDANGNDLADVGEEIVYTFVVKNTGAVTMTDVTVNDPMLARNGLKVTPGPQTLAPGEEAVFTATYVAKQEDIDGGKVENTATGTGTPPDGGTPIDSPPDTVIVPPDTSTELIIEKTATLDDQNGNELIDLGETIHYTFKVTNAGKVTMTDVTVDDPMLAGRGITITPGPQTLQPGESFTFEASYRPTPADIEAGSVVNVATAIGALPDGRLLRSLRDEAAIPPAKPSTLEVVKTGKYNDNDNNGYASLGDTVTYSFTITNTGDQVITDVSPVDEGPTFNGKPAAGKLSAFEPESVTLPAHGSQVFTATYALTQEDIDNAAGVEGRIENSATAKGTIVGGGEVPSTTSTSKVTIPSVQPSDITIIKQAGLRQIKRGEKAPFTITVTNHSTRNAGRVSVTDTIPAGFRYVEGSATIWYEEPDRTDPVEIKPIVKGRQVRFDDVELGPNAVVKIRLSMLALSTAGPGKHTNKAIVHTPDGEPLAPEARADVEIMIEPVFDCGDIVGKVFDDVNRNGYQDKGEPGLPGVRIATVRGSLVTTDKHGRFHVACADLPDNRIGSNFIMKLDPRTLPAGYRLTTENPRVIRLTAGKMSTLNFGASIGRVVRLDLTDAAFEPGTTILKQKWLKGLDRLFEALESEPSTLRLSYGAAADAALARERIEALEEDIAKRWKSVRGRYELSIETRVEAGQ
ncbi:DUF7507 domain-containing protein, partial [Brucella sp. SA075A]